MKELESKVPVLFLIFNREDVSIEAMKSIQEYQPDRIYIAADGPRAYKNGEHERCEDTRNAVLKMIDWPCKVNTLFRDENLGCAKAVSGAIDWFFSKEEFGVIVEDDMIISQDFYRFAKQMDDKYRCDERVMSINAQYIGKKHELKTSYAFSSYASPWGWASWRRAWKKMDMKMSLFPVTSFYHHLRIFGLVKGFLLYYYYWKRDYKRISSGGDISSWATRWAFSIFANGGYVVIPSVNLAVNVGCSGGQGTHYSAEDKDLYSFLTMETLPEILDHPDDVEYSKVLRRIENRDFFRIRCIGFYKKLKLKMTKNLSL